MKRRVWGMEFRKGKLTTNMGTRQGDLQSKLSKNLEPALWYIFSGIPEELSLIEGIFGYTLGNKPISAGHSQASAYVGENRKLVGRFHAKRFQEVAGGKCIRANGTITEY